MGLTVHYQGRLEGPVGNDFEAEIARLAAAMRVEAYFPTQSANDDRPVRGAIILLGEQVEPASLLVSSDGWLLPVTEIETEGSSAGVGCPWVSVKTQHGRIEAHITLIDLLVEVQRRWVPALRVVDEGLYWDTRNAAVLQAQRTEFAAAVDAMSAALADAGMNCDQHRDSNLNEKWVRQVAAKAHSTLRRGRKMH